MSSTFSNCVCYLKMLRNPPNPRVQLDEQREDPVVNLDVQNRAFWNYDTFDEELDKRLNIWVMKY